MPKGTLINLSNFSSSGQRKEQKKASEKNLDQAEIDKILKYMDSGNLWKINQLMEHGFDFNFIKVNDLGLSEKDDLLKRNDIVLNTLCKYMILSYTTYISADVGLELEKLHHKNSINKENIFIDTNMEKELLSKTIFCDKLEEQVHNNADDFDLILLFEKVMLLLDNETSEESQQNKKFKILDYLKENYPDEMLSAALALGDFVN